MPPGTTAECTSVGFTGRVPKSSIATVAAVQRSAAHGYRCSPPMGSAWTPAAGVGTLKAKGCARAY